MLLSNDKIYFSYLVKVLVSLDKKKAARSHYSSSKNHMCVFEKTQQQHKNKHNRF